LQKRVDSIIRLKLEFENPQKISSTAYGQDILYVQMKNHPNLLSSLSLNNIFNDSLSEEIFYLKPSSPSIE